MGAIIRSLVMVVTLSIFTGLVYPLVMTGSVSYTHLTLPTILLV